MKVHSYRISHREYGVYEKLRVPEIIEDAKFSVNCWLQHEPILFIHPEAISPDIGLFDGVVTSY